MSEISRRQFSSRSITALASFALGSSIPAWAAKDERPKTFAELETFIQSNANPKRDVGIAVCSFNASEILWSYAYGHANLESQTVLTPDHIQNIASVSKTITGAAVMQLVESGSLALDTDINTYLPFPVRNPHHPDTPITTRQLLTHTSSIQDGPAYGSSYACGDPSIPLQDWIEQYYIPGGKFYDGDKNFLKDTPGETHEYANVGYGLLGFLVEVVAKQDFAEYCKQKIFLPLGMDNTGWHIKDIDKSTHVTPYQYMTKAMLNSDEAKALLARDAEQRTMAPLCLYSFPNYPDGLLRTSVNQLARFGMSFLNDGGNILKPDTVKQIFTYQRERSDEPGQSPGLTWYGSQSAAGIQRWYHSGGDPGVGTLLMLHPEQKTGTVIFCNTDGTRIVVDIVKAALAIAEKA